MIVFIAPVRRELWQMPLLPTLIALLKPCPMQKAAEIFSLRDLAERVVKLLSSHDSAALAAVIENPSGALAETSLRRFKSVGLIDSPTTASNGTYGIRQVKQLATLCILQAKGVPLSEIQTALWGRSNDDLDKLSADALAEIVGQGRITFVARAEKWTSHILTDHFTLVAKNGCEPSVEQLTEIHRIVADISPPVEKGKQIQPMLPKAGRSDP